MTQAVNQTEEWNKKFTEDLAKAGFKFEENPEKADVTVTIEDNKKIVITTADGKRYEHDFGCNGYYAEMFRVLREMIGIDSRVKWFNQIKDKFFGSVCFGGNQASRW